MSKAPVGEMGTVVLASHVSDSGSDPRVQRIVLLLAACVALMMTGSGVIMPVFARRFGELGSGVETLGLMSMSFALAQLVSAPLMGSFADRFGRRPFVLTALAAFTLANIGFLLANSPAAIIVIRATGGVLTAGLFPAALGVIADIVPKRDQGRWIGIVMGSYGAGLVFGPVLGGILYDTWGYVAPFAVSATLACTAFIAATIVVPETRTPEARRREHLRARRTAVGAQETQQESFLDTLPKPLYVFGTLLVLELIAGFAYAFIEPQLLFYVYDQLNWSTLQFGIIAGTYGLTMVVGQVALGQLSDRLGRKPVIVVGFALTSVFYISLSLTAVFHSSLSLAASFLVILFAAIVAGMGEALHAPARGAFYFDITAQRHRSRILGIKSSALSLGGVLGPMLLVGASRIFAPQGIFGISAIVLILGSVLALVLREPRHTRAQVPEIAQSILQSRGSAAQTALRSIAWQAGIERQIRNRTRE